MVFLPGHYLACAAFTSLWKSQELTGTLLLQCVWLHTDLLEADESNRPSSRKMHLHGMCMHVQTHTHTICLLRISRECPALLKLIHGSITMARGLLGVDSEQKEPLWALACGMTLNKPLLWSSVSPSMLSGDASGHPWKPLLLSCVPLMPGPLRLKTTNPAAKTLESHINLTGPSVGSWRRGLKCTITDKA